MASQISPGIIVQERDFTNSRLQETITNVGAIAGPFTKGEVGVAKLITNEKELVETFGKPTAQNFEYWYTASEFLNYGGNLQVARIGSTTAGFLTNANSSGVASVKIENESDYEVNFESTTQTYKFAAKTPGTWGNTLKVVSIDSGADQILTFDKAPDVTPVNGSTLTFASGKTAKVYSFDALTNKVSVIASPSISVGDSIVETEDPIASFTHNGVTEAGRAPGTYTPAADAGGASFQVVVADAGVEGGGAATGVGGSVTVTILTAGDGYEVGDTITLAGAATGNGTAIVVTVATILDDETAVEEAVDWYDQQFAIPGLVKWNSIAPRPRTSPYVAERGGSNDEIHFVVIDEDGALTGTSNTILEKILYVSKASDAKTTEGEGNFFKKVIKGRSKYVYVTAFEDASVYTPVDGVSISDAGLSTQVYKLYGPKSYTLSAGTDYQNYNVGNETQTYLDVFSDIETLTIDYILCGPSTLAKANSLINLANTRKDCIAFISPQRSDVIGSDASNAASQAQNVVDFFESISDSSSYAVFDNNYKYIYDRFNDTYRWIPCNADVAGLCVNTTDVAEAWYSPAGFNRGNLRNAVRIAFNPNQAQRDDLYAKRVNPIVAFPGQGIVLFGDKTALRSPSAFDRINVRRLFLLIERTIKNFSKNVLFELNDVTTRNNFSSQVNNYLRDVQARRGMTDFLVVADESNNTPDVIDRNEFVADIYVKPSRSINFITLTFVATRTGVSFDEVVGRV